MQLEDESGERDDDGREGVEEEHGLSVVCVERKVVGDLETLLVASILVGYHTHQDDENIVKIELIDSLLSSLDLLFYDGGCVITDV